MSKAMDLADEMIDITVEHGIHRSGRKHADTPPHKILELMAGELMELAAAYAKGNGVERDFEVADVYIAFRHFVKKVGPDDAELAKCIAHKLGSRNSFHAVPERFLELKKTIEYRV